MKRKQRGALLRFERVFVIERLVVGWRFSIQHVTPSDGDDDDDDDTCIVHLEGTTDNYFYTSWPTCPFHTDKGIRINEGSLRCTMTYRRRAEHSIPVVLHMS